MSLPFKPENYNSVSPYLVVDGARSVVDFLKKAFNATDLRRFDGPDGRIMHAEVKIDDSVVMIADANANAPAFRSTLHVYVSDVDAVYRRALAAGGKSIQEPVQKGDPDKRGGVTDPAGNQWWISQQVGMK